jgi:hypothetical protein
MPRGKDCYRDLGPTQLGFHSKRRLTGGSDKAAGRYTRDGLVAQENRIPVACVRYSGATNTFAPQYFRHLPTDNPAGCL